MRVRGAELTLGVLFASALAAGFAGALALWEGPLGAFAGGALEALGAGPLGAFAAAALGVLAAPLGVFAAAALGGRDDVVSLVRGPGGALLLPLADDDFGLLVLFPLAKPCSPRLRGLTLAQARAVHGSSDTPDRPLRRAPQSHGSRSRSGRVRTPRGARVLAAARSSGQNPP
jgi:hypothetical protein